jgi:hypothetical protein
MRSKVKKVKENPMPNLIKIGLTINAKKEYNEKIIQAYENRISFLEKQIAAGSENRDQQTRFAMELAELKHKLFFQKGVLETWKIRGIEHEMDIAEATKNNANIPEPKANYGTVPNPLKKV